ncbi:MAG: M24 family metallopeptidase [Bacillota bacterium]
MTGERIVKLRQKMASLGLDGFLVLESINRRYLSGFTGTSGLLLITLKNNFLFTDFRYLEQAAVQAPEFQVVKHEFPVSKTIREVVQRMTLEAIGVESEHITYKQYQDFVENLPGIKLLPQEGVIETLRMVKDEQELLAIKKAAEIADKAFNHIITKVKPGVSELSIAVELEYFMRSLGASATSFETIVASGCRSALPHGVASEKIIEKGDFVTLDFGCICQGYCSDMTRTIVIGQPSDKQRQIYEIVLEAQIKGLEAVKADLGAKEVDLVSRTHISRKGYGEFFGHGLGHGLGLKVHENPSLSPRDNTQLLENMVVTIEPGIYLANWGGVRIEDLVVVKDGGYENLTHSIKDLIII